MEKEEVVDELAEKDRLSGGQADIAGVGDIEGDGEESLVKGGEYEGLLSGDELEAVIGMRRASLIRLYITV